MNRKEAFYKIQELFRDFFNDNSLVLEEDTSTENFEEWDSVAHIQLVLEIEAEFDILFEAEQIGEITSIKAILDYLNLDEKE